MRALLRRAWGGQPPWARWIRAAYLAGFADGFGAHLRDLARYGLHAYSAVPHLALRALFLGLVVLDPLAAVLVTLTRRAGTGLAAAVMAADVTANLTGNWAVIERLPASMLLSANLLGILLFGAFVLVTAVPLLRAARTPAVPG